MTENKAHELGYRLEFYKVIIAGYAVATLNFNGVKINDFFSFSSSDNYLDHCYKHHTINNRKNKWNKVKTK